MPRASSIPAARTGQARGHTMLHTQAVTILLTAIMVAAIAVQASFIATHGPLPLPNPAEPTPAFMDSLGNGLWGVP